MRYSGLLYLVAFLIFLPAAGQEDSGNESGNGELLLKLKSVSFVKNNEYSNPITEGYTLIGYFLQPELIYKADEKVCLSLGAHLLSFSGTGNFADARPVFSATYGFNENTFFRIGTLKGSDEHRMLDPHFNRERIYSAYAEDGLQFTTSGERIFSDTWLSWENYIFRGDNEREIFTAGESFRYMSPFFAGSMRMEVPVQIQFKHYGGQISDYDEGVETYLNIAAGIALTAGLDRGSSRAGFEALFFSGSSMTGNAPSGIESGYAGWYKMLLETGMVSIEAGYWDSDNFYAPNGNFIFSSVPERTGGSIINKRSLLTFLFSINLPYKDFLDFHFGFDGYYDTNLKRFDNALSLHLRFDKLFCLATRKQ